MLTKLQLEIVDECMKKKRGCLCVPMGTGKTLISLHITRLIGSNTPALIVCSKTLVGSWISEIHKFFGTSIKYDVYHKDHMTLTEFESYSPGVGTDLVITTPEVLSKVYKETRVDLQFVTGIFEDRGGMFPVLVNRYNVPKTPFLTVETAKIVPNAFIYAFKWKCMIIDEVQQFTEITSQRCQALSAVCSKFRWATSGTPIAEPKVERIMGYYALIGDSTFPNCAPDAERYLKSAEYPGIRPTMVVRTRDQLDFTLPPCVEHIISHELTREEMIVYVSLKDVIRKLAQEAKRNRGNITLVRSINAQLLSMICFTREFLVCPLVPYASLMRNGSKKNEMSTYFTAETEKLNLKDWLENPDAARSSRVIAITETVNKHAREKCVVFSCYRVNLNVVKHYLTEDTGRQTFTIESKDSMIKRGETISKFEETENGVLCLTYALGAEGLNLQKSHVVLLADVGWNDSSTAQAIARVLRRGQTEPVTVYFFTSETGMEQGMYNKHIDKRNLITKLMDGKMDGTVRTLKIRDIVQLILQRVNTDTLREARLLANG